MEVCGVLQDLKGGQCSQSVAREGRVHKTMLERGETLEAFPLNVDNYDYKHFKGKVMKTMIAIGY